MKVTKNIFELADGLGIKCFLLNLKLLADIISNSAIIYVVFPEVILIIWQMLGSIKFNVR